jgi:hypothetical protein
MAAMTKVGQSALGLKALKHIQAAQEHIDALAALGKTASHAAANDNLPTMKALFSITDGEVAFHDRLAQLADGTCTFAGFKEFLVCTVPDSTVVA